eukprot:5502856-Pyramimonas_sp.AAC.1
MSWMLQIGQTDLEQAKKRLGDSHMSSFSAGGSGKPRAPKVRRQHSPAAAGAGDLAMDDSDSDGETASEMMKGVLNTAHR